MLDSKYPPRSDRHANTDSLPRQHLDPMNTWAISAQKHADHGAAQNTTCAPSGVRHSQKDAKGMTKAKGTKMERTSKDFRTHFSIGSAILTKNGCPEDLRKFWLGHENPDISDDYAEQLLEDIERRQEVAARIGLGFEIPEASFVPKVPKTPELEAVAVAA